MGFSNAVTDLTGYLASWLYGLLMFGFPMVYCIILGNRLVAKMVDNSSFSYLLSTPNSRVKIIITQGIYALASIAVLFAALFGVGVLTCSAMFREPWSLAHGGDILGVNIAYIAVIAVLFTVSVIIFKKKRLPL